MPIPKQDFNFNDRPEQYIVLKPCNNINDEESHKKNYFLYQKLYIDYNQNQNTIRFNSYHNLIKIYC